MISANRKSPINAVLLKPMPYPEAERIVEIEGNPVSPVVCTRLFLLF